MLLYAAADSRFTQRFLPTPPPRGRGRFFHSPTVFACRGEAAGGSAPGGALVLVRVGLKYRPCSDAFFALHHMSYQALWSSLCPKPITKPQSMPRSTQWLDRSCTNFPSLMLQLLATPS